MKPRIQCVLTQWKPGFIASGNATGEADASRQGRRHRRIRRSRPGSFGTEILNFGPCHPIAIDISLN
jgi:hypothetical protein